MGGISKTTILPETGAGNGIFYGPIPLSTGGAAAENGIIAAAAKSSYEQQLPELSVSPNSLQGLLTKTVQGSDGWESETLFSDQIPWDSVSSQFWETLPKNPSVALVEIDGEEIVSVSPGPDDMVRVIVQLKEDPVAIIKVRTRGAQPSYAAAQAIRDHQQGILEAHTIALAAMAKEELSFVPVQHYSYTFNGIAGSVRMKDMSALARLPEVEHVYYDYQVHITLADSVPLIGAPDVWLLEDSLSRTVTGKGITVAIVDTGIDYTHPDLGGCLGPPCRVIGGYDFVNDDTDPMDDMGHGTHVAGIVGASGITTGVAPDVSFLAYKVLGASGSGSFSDVIAGIEKATDPDGDPNTDDSADIINLSLGGGGNP